MSVYAQQKKFDVSYQNKKLLAVFADLKSKTGYHFTYDKEVINESGSVSLNLQNASIENILKHILGEKGYEFQIDKNIIFVTSGTPPSLSKKVQSVVVTGTVSDSKGTPISGATITVKNAEISSMTDATGRYLIQLSDNKPNTLIFSFMGKERQEVSYRGQLELNITLQDHAAEIEDVVITGIFKKSRESYTGAVTTITEKELSLYRGQNLLQTLKNIDPAINILVNNNLGSNPNAVPELNIRGTSSLPMNVQEFNEGVRQQVNTPLIIMDGFEISLTKLMDYSDAEIQSINILKDASATAIYGSRGANGVIVVVTKPPVPGKLRVSFQGGVNFDLPDLTSYNLLNASEKLELERVVGLYNQPNIATTHLSNQDIYMSRYKDVLEGVNTDWLSQPVRTGIGQRYNLRIEGGSDEFRWGTTMGYNSVGGAMKGSKRDNFNGSVILSYSYKNLIFRNQTSVGLNKGVESPYGSFSLYAKAQPYERIYDENGTLRPYFLDFSRGTRITNPLYDAQLNTLNQNKYTELINNFSIEWDLAQHLKLRGQLGLSKKMSTSDKFLPAEHSTFLTETYSGIEGAFRKGSYDYTTGEGVNADGNVTLNYSRVLNEVHQLYAGLDYSISQRDDFSYAFSAEGFSNEDLNFIGNALQYKLNAKPSATENKSRRIGVTTNLNYTYDNRYFVDGSVRMDGSSQFGTKNKFAPFWSVGLGWNIHNEHFIKSNTFLNTLRIRGSIGQTGSQQFSAYQALSTFQYYSDQRYALWNAAELMGFGNENLKWQMTDQINGGLEFAVLKNRINGSIDIYTKKTSNLLSSMNIPLATGFSSYVDNVGAVKNNGFEAALSGYIIRDNEKDMMWMLSGKLAYNRNKITELSEAIKIQNELYQNQNVEVSSLFFEGRPQNAIYAVRSLGIDPSSGKEIYLDKNGVITDRWYPSDKVFLGAAEPLYRGNLSSMFSFKGLTLNLSFGYNWGGYIYNQTLSDRVEVTPDGIANQNVDRRVLDARWMNEGDNTFFKGFADNYSTRASSRFVMRDKTIELQSMALQYRLNPKRLKLHKIESIMFGANMSDIFYISTVKRERGTDYPYARHLSTTLSLTF